MDHASRTEQQEYLAYIQQNIHKLDRFIHDINDYSKNSRLEVAYEPINLQAMVEEIVETLAYLPAAQAAKINIEIEKDLAWQSDKKRLRIILSNLLSNAFKYSRHSIGVAPIVRINAYQAKQEVIITVEDNGMGIAQEYLPKVFDMFYQANKEAKGTGLGLYIVQQTVQKLNGDIQIRSTLDVGTTFTIILPSNTTGKNA